MEFNAAIRACNENWGFALICIADFQVCRIAGCIRLDAKPKIAIARQLIRKSTRIARVGAFKDYKPFNRANIPQGNAYAPTQQNCIIYLQAATTTTALSK
ncbi:MAG: hypothetical protein ACXWJB_06510 [Limisphaerales bacterium]